MNRKMLRLGRLAGLSAVVAAALATMSLLDASAAVKPDSCPTNKPLVVDSYATFENAGDYGADGHFWALDAATVSIRIWGLGGDAYCLQYHYVGTFTTVAGLSPEGTSTLSGGSTGSWDGTAYQRIYGTFAPTLATTGFIGNFDPQCGQDGTCPGYFPSARDLYFSSVFSYHYGAYAVTYDGGACGTWVQTSSGDTGDIVC